MTGAILMGLGFSPLAASGLSLIANTAPVAYGALGTPIQGLATVTGLDPYLLGAMVGRQLPFFSLIVPFWLIWAFAGFRGMMQIWPAILVCGVSLRGPAIPGLELRQSLDRRHRRLPGLHGLPGRLPARSGSRAEIWTLAGAAHHGRSRPRPCRRPPPPAIAAGDAGARSAGRWMPWVILSVVVAIWGTGWFKSLVNPIFTWNYPVEGLHNMIQKVPPVVAKPAAEGAVFAFTYLSYTGTGILIAAIIAGLRDALLAVAARRGPTAETLWVVRYSLLTIVAMLAIGTLTRYSGLDATLGLAFAARACSTRSSARCSAGSASR